MMRFKKLVLASVILLALLVVLSINIFLFSTFMTIWTQRCVKISTIYEQDLCYDVYPSTKNDIISPTCPKNGIVSVIKGGRLGNLISEYGSVWAIARYTGLQPYVPRCMLKRLEEFFENLSIPALNSIGECSINIGNIVNSLEVWKNKDQSIFIPKCVYEWYYIKMWLDDFRHEFTFKKSLRRYAESVLRAASHPYNISDPIYIGVHVRRDDYIDFITNHYKSKPATKNFYLKAMDYYQNKYENVIFVVASDDITWCKRIMRQPNYRVHFVTSGNAADAVGQDLSVLAACNHSLIDYGTYGSVSAILAGGETIVYNISSEDSATRVAIDLPKWKFMTNDGF